MNLNLVIDLVRASLKPKPPWVIKAKHAWGEVTAAASIINALTPEPDQPCGTSPSSTPTSSPSR